MNLQMVTNVFISFGLSSTYRPALYGLDGGHGMVLVRERDYRREKAKVVF
jgi:hypothetical protein